MGISSKLSARFNELGEQAKKKLIKLAWTDKISYQEITKEFGFTANEVEKFMRSELTEKEFKRWKVRQSKRFSQKSKKAAKLKHDDY